MHSALSMFGFAAFAVLLNTNAQYHGILMRGKYGGTQLYDPFNTPHARGNLSLGLDLQYPEGSRAVIHGQLAYFASGYSDASFCAYNTATNTTRTLAPMPQWRDDYGMTALPDTGNVLVCGGWNNGVVMSTCMLYSAAGNTWSTNAFAPLPVPITYFTIIILQGRPYALGGWNDSGKEKFGEFNSVYVFDKGAWTARANMPQALSNLNAVALNGTSALECGGLNSTSTIPHCYAYSATNDKWTTAASLDTSRCGHGMAVYKGRVLVYGGYSQNSTVLASVEMLSMDAQSWSLLPTLMFVGDEHFASVPLPD